APVPDRRAHRRLCRTGGAAGVLCPRSTPRPGPRHGRADRARGLLPGGPRDVPDAPGGHGSRDRWRHHGASHHGARKAAWRKAVDPLRPDRGAAGATAAPARAGTAGDRRAESLAERVKTLTKGVGADVVCEAVGKPELVAEALALVKTTGILQLVGVHPKGAQLPIDLY